MVNSRMLFASAFWVPKPCAPWASQNTPAGVPMWPFKSPTEISVSLPQFLGNNLLQQKNVPIQVQVGPLEMRTLKGRWNCLADDKLEKNDPVRDALDVNNFVCPVLCQQYAGLSTENYEFAVLAQKSSDLFGFKAFRIPVFLHTTEVDLSLRQSLHHFGTSFIQGYQIPSGNPHLGRGLLNRLGLVCLSRGLIDLPQRSDPDSHPREELKPKFLPAFRLRWLLAPHITFSKFNVVILFGASFWWSGCPAWPPPQLYVQRKPGISVRALIPSQFSEDLGLRQSVY